jgi:hypothetical protein
VAILKDVIEIEDQSSGRSLRYSSLNHSRGSVGQHAERSRDLGEISTGDERGRLVADTELETGRTPVDELDGPLGLDVDDGGVDIPGHTVSSVEQTGGHVFTLTRVTLDHLRRGLETGVGHLGDRVGLVEGWRACVLSAWRRLLLGKTETGLPFSAPMIGA